MARKKLDPETRKAIRDAQRMIADVAKADGNESETRRRVERIFESIMGYDIFKHITREHAIRGAGTTEHCDFAIQIDQGEETKPVIMVELKRVNIDLSPKHLKQVSSYAINIGCEWILLTNGKEWRLYHVSYGQPPETKLMQHWDLLNDDLAAIAAYFDVISYRNVKRSGLDELWQKASVLTPRNVLSAIVSEDSIKLIRRDLKKSTGVSVTPEEIVGALRRLLNENALIEMEDIKIIIPERKRQQRAKSPRQGEVKKQQESSPTDLIPEDKNQIQGETFPEAGPN